MLTTCRRNKRGSTPKESPHALCSYTGCLRSATAEGHQQHHHGSQNQDTYNHNSNQTTVKRCTGAHNNEGASLPGDVYRISSRLSLGYGEAHRLALASSNSYLFGRPRYAVDFQLQVVTSTGASAIGHVNANINFLVELSL